jgi:acid stress-induced BolA-like protein IbaG/YrbA
MLKQDIENLLHNKLTDCQIKVNLEGNSAQINIIGTVFAGLSRIKRQQLVYQAIGKLITDGSLHAVTINTYTPDETGK